MDIHPSMIALPPAVLCQHSYHWRTNNVRDNKIYINDDGRNMSACRVYSTRMQDKQDKSGWSWDMMGIPKCRRVSLTRRCFLDKLFRDALQQQRISSNDLTVLDFLFGLSTGHARTQQETCARFGLTDTQVREIKFGGLCGDSREWAKMLLAEAYEGEGGMNFVRSRGEWPWPRRASRKKEEQK